MKKLGILLGVILIAILSSCEREDIITQNDVITTSPAQLSRLAYQFGVGMEGYYRLEPLVVNGVTYQNWTLNCPRIVGQPFNYTCHYFLELNGDVTVGMANLNKGEFKFKSSLVNDHLINISIINFFDQEDENAFLYSGKYKIHENQIYEGSLLGNIAGSTVFFQEGEYKIHPPRDENEKGFVEIPLVY